VKSQWENTARLTTRDRASSLIDETDYFYRFERMPEFLAQVNLDQLEVEFRDSPRACPR